MQSVRWFRIQLGSLKHGLLETCILERFLLTRNAPFWMLTQVPMSLLACARVGKRGALVRSVRKPFWGYVPRSGGSDSAPKESLIAGNSPIFSSVRIEYNNSNCLSLEYTVE